MERPSRGRAHTFTWGMSSLFTNPLKAAVTPPSAPNETIGWKPNTLQRSNSGLSTHHVLSCRPSLPFREVPNLLKRQLSSGSQKHIDADPKVIPRVTVQEVISPGAHSYSSGSSSRRILFVPKLLKPVDSGTSVKKLRCRTPSPYPDARQLPKLASMTSKNVVPREPVIRGRVRTLTMERIDGILNGIHNHVDRYLDEHPEALPPPGSTPAFVDAYWKAERQRRHSADSALSNPEVEDDASDVEDVDTESNTSFGSDESVDSPGCVWDCETAYDSDRGNLLEPAPRQDTPAATRPPLMRRADACAPSGTPYHDDSTGGFPGHGVIGTPESPSTTMLVCAPNVAPALTHFYQGTTRDPSWLPTDPSALSVDCADRPVPNLLWTRGITSLGVWFLSSVHPPPDTTAGGPEGGPGGPMPSHTPNPGFSHRQDSRFDPVDAEQLRSKLQNVTRQLRSSSGRLRGESGGNAYDEEQMKIWSRYASWEGGIGKDEWLTLEGSKPATRVEGSSQHPDVNRGAQDYSSGVAGAPRKDKMEQEGNILAVTETFPDYKYAELAFAAWKDDYYDDATVPLPDYEAALPSSGDCSRWPKTGYLPKSKTHRERAASKLETTAPQEGLRFMAKATSAVPAQAGV